MVETNLLEVESLQVEFKHWKPSMRVRYLGHAGFDIWNTNGGRLICDPWVSGTGAFLGSWFQFPQNHHLAQSLSNASPDNTVIYISHHHRDHFDREFLKAVDKEIELCVPRFVRRHFTQELKSLGFRRITELLFGETIDRHGFRLTMFVDDCYANEDSGVLIESDGTRFLNMNDCRAYDRISPESLQPLDLFTVQFSGASWFPSVYDYAPRSRDEHSRIKNERKYRNVVRVTSSFMPKLYIPSAGPPCFLDPLLMQHNFGNPSPFPDAADFQKHMEAAGLPFKFIFPGDSVQLAEGSIPIIDGASGLDAEFYREPEKHSYIKKYAESMSNSATYYQGNGDAWEDLLGAAKMKVSALRDALPVERSLVFTLDYGDVQPSRHILIDLKARTAIPIDGDLPETVYQYTFNNGVMVQFFHEQALWEDLLLSLRFSIHRVPDEFDPTIADFVRLQVSDLKRYPFAIHKSERVIREINGSRYEFDRYCPHNNGDMLHADVVDGNLVCPRHGWCFDIVGGGRCTDNHSSLNARPVCD